MNGRESEQLARQDERLKSIHSDLQEIKDKLNSMSGCINTAEMAINSLDLRFTQHLREHKAVYGGVITLATVLATTLSIVL